MLHILACKIYFAISYVSSYRITRLFLRTLDLLYVIPAAVCYKLFAGHVPCRIYFDVFYQLIYNRLKNEVMVGIELTISAS